MSGWEENRDRLLIVWSSEEQQVAEKLVLLYGSVMLPREYWKEAIVMIWGPSAKLLAQNKEIQEKFAAVTATGVKACACVVCTDDYGVSDKLSSMGVELMHTGELMTNCLKDGWRVVTF